MGGPTQPSPLLPPEAAHRVLAFINTRKNRLQEDHFGSHTLLGQWLHQHGWTPADQTITAAQLDRVHQLRAALVTLMLSHVEGPLELEPKTLALAREQLNALAQDHPLHTEWRDHEARLVPAGSGVERALAQVLADVTELSLTGAWTRMKACHNPVCQQGFYDRTRNGAGSFCSQNPCGAQVAMRAYRERKRKQTPAEP